MPAPGSYIDITTIPFTRVVTQAEFNVSNEIWFRYIATVPIVIGLQTNSGGTFTPRTLIADNAGATLRALVTGTKGQYFMLETANTYYIQIVRNGGGASNFDFTFTADTASLNSATPVAGDYLVNDDTTGFPAALVDGATGAIKGYFSTIPSGEMGVIRPDNTSLWHDRFGEFSVSNKIASVLDNLTFDASLSAGTNNSTNFPRFAYDRSTDRIYLLDQTDELWYIDNTGVATDTGFFFPADSPQAIAISPDGTKLYYVFSDIDTSIHVKTLSTFADLADLYTVPVVSAGDITFAQASGGWHGDMFTLDNGDVVTWYQNTAGDLHYHLLHVSAAGSLLHDVDFGADVIIDHLAISDFSATDEISIWSFDDFTLAIARFGIWNLTAGSYGGSDVTATGFSAGIGLAGTDKFGVSTSCTFLMMMDLTPPPTFGQITVTKVTVPSGLTQAFEFTAGGGLSPSSFTLNGDGDQQVFLLVPTGSGYSIEETEDDRYDTVITVSNLSPNTNITVGEDENVQVTVTNTFKSGIGSGIYKIVPGDDKRTDTLWNANTSGTTVVKIPNPFGTSGMIGD